ncbi:MAG: DUF1559 domain-containing protein [Pirellulales bacterium]
MSRYHRIAAGLLMAVVVTAGSVTSTPAQQEADAQPPQLDLSYIPEGAVAASVTFPRRMMTREDMQLLPIEIISALGKRDVGIDPVDIETAIFIVTATSQQRSPQPAFILYTIRPYEAAAVAAKIVPGAGQQIENGRTIYQSQRLSGFSLHMPNQRTMLFAPLDTLKAMMSADDAQGHLHARLRQMDTSADVFWVVSVETLRPMIKPMLDQAPIPPQLAELRKLVDVVSSIEVTVDDIGAVLGISAGGAKIVLRGSNEQDAAEIERLVKQGLEVGRMMVNAQIVQEFQNQNMDSVQQATLTYLQRLSNTLFQAVQPEREGQTVAISIDHSLGNIGTTGMLVGLLLPAVNSAREAARRMESQNNLKQIALAMHVYHAQANHLPARASFDEEGNALLSWRVHLLPYLEQEALYDQFKLDEPWDSPHNKQLIAQMPKIYKTPNTANIADGKTVYQVPVGEGTIFPGTEETTFAEIRDGTSNTILALEVDADEAVEWTKPEDYQVDPDRPMRGLGNLRPQHFLAAFADGSVRVIQSSVDPATLKAMFTASGGEAVRP